MLSITPQDLQPQPYYYLPFRSVSLSHRQPQPEIPFFTFTSMGSPPFDTMTAAAAAAAAAAASARSAQDASVAQALEIARESPDGSSDPTISKILEGALAQIWGKVQAQPNSYVMTRDEFAVFNFFQHRFTGDKTAVSARKRYWDNARA
ncbi:hypothetical protein BGZ61DRAFT_532221 [Ilyonectria robusta]|uniref:uncharacterized protein n=1 Tax=Ilyonectria robusta TaxID=1079257 RepID=UPI001E8EBC2D|nr:uncharacterized protein BGZ61DRAFT_532221 [Ilyonectria robusta]KAH8699745.1 hypothetical protein BGZ61DRAFT_532221 [Ilyonectria robusta]